jgi:hypothetical protein
MDITQDTAAQPVVQLCTKPVTPTPLCLQGTSHEVAAPQRLRLVAVDGYAPSGVPEDHDVLLELQETLGRLAERNITEDLRLDLVAARSALAPRTRRRLAGLLPVPDEDRWWDDVLRICDRHKSGNLAAPAQAVLETVRIAAQARGAQPGGR